MKIFIHGNGDWAKEINNFFVYYHYYSKDYRYEIGDLKEKKIKKIKCVGFSHTDTLDNFDIKKIKKYYHLVCSSKKQEIFEKFIIDNDLKILPYLMINTPFIKEENEIGKGVVVFHSYLGNGLIINNFSFIGPLNIISNRVTIGKNCVLYQKNTIEKDVVIGDKTIISSNVTINKGVKIGNNCYIGPNQNIITDIPEDCMFINNKIIKGLH